VLRAMNPRGKGALGTARAAIGRAARVSGIAVALIGLSGPASAGADSFLWSSPFAKTPADEGVSAGLTSLSCPTRLQCTAVALDDHQATWRTGISTRPVWVLIGASAGINRVAFTGVACTTRSHCTAIDQDGDAVTFSPTARTRPPRTRVDPDFGPTNAIACPSVSQCTVVDSDGSEVTFNPRALRRESSHQVATGYDDLLFGVACPSVIQCTAVDEGGYETTFNPRAPQGANQIQIDTTSAVEDLPPYLRAVACPTVSQCTAVDVGGSEITFNPTAPANSAPVLITGGVSLNGVACPAASQCTAVDSDGGEETFDPAAPVGVARRLIAKNHKLVSVACPALDECVTADAEDNLLVGLPIRATTEKPGPARATGVTLRGRIEARGEPVSWRFQFGRGTRYEKSTRAHRLDSKRATAGVSETLGHLAPNTVYHVRLVLITLGSEAPTVTAYGRDLTFKTEPRR
jgi:hypothetical protein